MARVSREILWRYSCVRPDEGGVKPVIDIVCSDYVSDARADKVKQYQHFNVDMVPAVVSSSGRCAPWKAGGVPWPERLVEMKLLDNAAKDRLVDRVFVANWKWQCRAIVDWLAQAQAARERAAAAGQDIVSE
ncbi:hypothetical protein J8273_5518 [Carpediemonas membranifera]|uniref:Uncharacterized protein n=1 Tax=Carpediemonas membranifera TaxID=201153 RepID=A0A8J6DYN4_9EUKA|nr:hypothetical protein J8273_5518 [Carpediemonas membranifera]|eukprot:KAG9392514.1 hypothetical protein J8273_5518 [Carpediemonas membranifera]